MTSEFGPADPSDTRGKSGTPGAPSPPPPRPEAWLRGPVAGVPPPLQPAAHALLQATEDLETLLAGLSTEELWHGPGGAASAGFHALHAAGALDRLYTYARDEPLSPGQRAALAEERSPDPTIPVAELLARFRRAVDAALAQLRATPESALTAPRAVGRAQLPSTVLGLLFHGAEHTARHAGQISTTVRVLRGLQRAGD